MFFSWLSNYKSSFLFSDILAGLTLASVVLPQALAYGQMTGLPAIYGLYTSLFPVLIFGIFTNSEYLSIGTFGVMSLLLKKLLDQIMQTIYITDDGNEEIEDDLEIRKKIIFLFTFLCGIFNLLLSGLKFGKFLQKYFLVSCFISALTCAASFHIVFSQLKPVFGLKYNAPSHFGLIGQLYYFLKNIQHSQWIDIILGFTTFFLIHLLKYLNALRIPLRFKKQFQSLPTAEEESISILEEQKESPQDDMIEIPKVLTLNLPEFLVPVFLLTMISYFITTPIDRIGEIPYGLPQLISPFPSHFCYNQICPSFLEIFSAMLTQIITLSLCSFLLTASILQLFPSNLKKHSLDRELLALSFTTLLAPFFSAYLPTGSLSRSALLYQSGAKSPLSSLFCFLICLGSIFFLSPLMKYIPQSVLGGMVWVAVGGVLTKIQDGILLFKEVYSKKSRGRTERNEDRAESPLEHSPERNFHNHFRKKFYVKPNWFLHSTKTKLSQCFVWWTVFFTIIFQSVPFGLFLGCLFCLFGFLHDLLISDWFEIGICRSLENHLFWFQFKEQVHLLSQTKEWTNSLLPPNVDKEKILELTETKKKVVSIRKNVFIYQLRNGTFWRLPLLISIFGTSYFDYLLKYYLLNIQKIIWDKVQSARSLPIFLLLDFSQLSDLQCKDNFLITDFIKEMKEFGIEVLIISHDSHLTIYHALRYLIQQELIDYELT